MSDQDRLRAELKSIIGGIPNYIFEYLELSEDIKKGWKLGTKASDFGGHNQFVQKFEQRIQAIIAREVRLGQKQSLIKLVKATTERKKNETWEQWSFRVVDYIRDELKTLEKESPNE